MFTAARFTAAKTWKQPMVHRHPSVDNEDVVPRHRGVRLRIIQNEIMPFAATRMDLELIVLTEVHQRKINII